MGDERTVARSIHFWIVLHPGQEGEEVREVRGRRVVVGRGEDCDVVLQDQSVSRQHAVISLRAGRGLVIEDLDSANGTLVNGRPIRSGVGFTPSGTGPVAELQGGDWLQFGDTMAVISLVPPSPGT
jgi:pSer/pThr/pTyr-binding forkhead associated (FHA) protein